MTTLSQVFGTSTSLTVNATAWANLVIITTTAIDVSSLSPVPDDILITVTGTAGTPMTVQKGVNVWVAISEDGTHFTDNDLYSGTQNTQTTLRAPSGHYGPYVIPLTASVAFWGVIGSLRAICGGTLPRKWGLVLENQTGQTITGPAATYTPITWTNT